MSPSLPVLVFFRALPTTQTPRSPLLLSFPTTIPSPTRSERSLETPRQHRRRRPLDKPRSQSNKSPSPTSLPEREHTFNLSEVHERGATVLAPVPPARGSQLAIIQAINDRRRAERSQQMMAKGSAGTSLPPSTTGWINRSAKEPLASSPGYPGDMRQATANGFHGKRAVLCRRQR